MSISNTSVPGGSPPVNNNGAATATPSNGVAANTATPIRVIGDVEVEIVATSPGVTRRDLMYVDAHVVTPGQYQGQALQEMYGLDPASDYARGRLLALTLATGIGRVVEFHATDLIGRRMLVRANGHGGWWMERTSKPTITVSADLVAMTDAAEEALTVDPGLFVRAGAPARVIRSGFKVPEHMRKLRITPPTGAPTIDVVSPANLRAEPLRAGLRSR